MPRIQTCMPVAARRRCRAHTIVVVRGTANPPEPADGPLKFLLVAAPRRYQHHPTPEWPTPCRGGSPGQCFRCLFAARTCAPDHGKQSRDIFGHEHIWRLVTGAAGERRTSLSKDRIVTRPLTDGRRLTKSGGGALFFPTLVGLRHGETAPSQAKIPLHQRRNLLVLGALAGWVWGV